MSYLVFTSEEEAWAAVEKRDKELGYPESLESLRYVGGGRHCAKSVGRAMHYFYPLKRKDKSEWWIADTPSVAAESQAIQKVELEGKIHIDYERELDVDI